MTEPTINKIREITRIFAIPLLILWWLLTLIELLIWFMCCILDFNLDDFGGFVVDIGKMIENFLEKGAKSL